MTPDKTHSEAELLPCPFCGEAAKHSFNSLYGDMSMASCKSCGATAYAPKWNRRAVLAKWGSPVVAGEVVAWRVRRHDAPNYWIVFLHYPVDAMADPEREVQPLFATPQPTRSQAGAVPLTPEQARDLIELESWGPDAIGLNAQLLRTIRRTEAAVRDQMLEADMAKLTKRGAVAWTGIDAQDLRDGGKP